MQHHGFGRLAVLDRVLEEVLRLHTPNRRADHLGGYRIPAGAEVGLSLTPLHRDPRAFDSPLAFDPGR